MLEGKGTHEITTGLRCSSAFSCLPRFSFGHISVFVHKGDQVSFAMMPKSDLEHMSSFLRQNIE